MNLHIEYWNVELIFLCFQIVQDALKPGDGASGRASGAGSRRGSFNPVAADASGEVSQFQLNF